MREIKLRAWDELNKSFEYIDFSKPNSIPIPESVVWTYSKQLFTGLKDKNGKEIYEGDIIRFTPIDYDKNQIVLPVVWDAASCGFHCSDGYASRGVDMASGYDTISGEIIGNIYSNPELLNKKV